MQRWLKELRRLRAKVTRELADEERVEALRAKGQSTKAALQLIRRADAAAGRKRDKRRSRRGKDDDLDDHHDDAYGLLLKRMPFAGIVKMFSSTNPAELIVRLLQQLTWTLLLLLKAIGVTLFGSVVSLGRCTGRSRDRAAPYARRSTLGTIASRRSEASSPSATATCPITRARR